MIHYPPFNEGDEESEFMKIFKEYNVEKVIYGHLHGPGRFKAKTGLINDIEYILTQVKKDIALHEDLITTLNKAVFFDTCHEVLPDIEAEGENDNE